MTRIRLHPGTTLSVLTLLMLSAGCGEHRSVLGPTDGPLAKLTAERAAVTPGSTIAGPPALSFYNSDFRYTYPSGGYSTDPQYQVPIVVTAGEPVTVNWFARPRGGAQIRAYRWALDIADVLDETPRVNEATDPAPRSRFDPATRSGTVGPFATGEQHLLYVDVVDSNGFRSLGMVRMQVAETDPEHPVRH